MNYEESDDNKCEVGEQHKNNNNKKKLMIACLGFRHEIFFPKQLLQFQALGPLKEFHLGLITHSFTYWNKGASSPPDSQTLL